MSPDVAALVPLDGRNYVFPLFCWPRVTFQLGSSHGHCAGRYSGSQAKDDATASVRVARFQKVPLFPGGWCFCWDPSAIPQWPVCEPQALTIMSESSDDLKGQKWWEEKKHNKFSVGLYTDLQQGSNTGDHSLLIRLDMSG